ncbi:hypothetical protein HDV05_002282 [Chytridiales sp. JEL 0842]|nr:hypothetical protein HDV05_002282 [Chytridiales sp. JEL 0842]
MVPLTGKVILSLSKPLSSCMALTLHVQGKLWADVTGALQWVGPEIQGVSPVQKVLLDRETLLWKPQETAQPNANASGSGGGGRAGGGPPVDLPAGEHEWHFTVCVPATLPPSVWLSHGKIEYSIKAKMSRRGLSPDVSSGWTLFTLVRSRPRKGLGEFKEGSSGAGGGGQHHHQQHQVWKEHQMKDPDGMFKIRVLAPPEGFLGDPSVKMQVEVSILKPELMDCLKALKVYVKEKRSFSCGIKGSQKMFKDESPLSKPAKYPLSPLQFYTTHLSQRSKQILHAEANFPLAVPTPTLPPPMKLTVAAPIPDAKPSFLHQDLRVGHRVVIKLDLDTEKYGGPKVVFEVPLVIVGASRRERGYWMRVMSLGPGAGMGNVVQQQQQQQQQGERGEKEDELLTALAAVRLARPPSAQQQQQQQQNRPKTPQSRTSSSVSPPERGGRLKQPTPQLQIEESSGVPKASEPLTPATSPGPKSKTPKRLSNKPLQLHIPPPSTTAVPALGATGVSISSSSVLGGLAEPHADAELSAANGKWDVPVTPISSTTTPLTSRATTPRTMPPPPPASPRMMMFGNFQAGQHANAVGNPGCGNAQWVPGISSSSSSSAVGGGGVYYPYHHHHHQTQMQYNNQTYAGYHPNHPHNFAHPHPHHHPQGGGHYPLILPSAAAIAVPGHGVQLLSHTRSYSVPGRLNTAPLTPSSPTPPPPMYPTSQSAFARRPSTSPHPPSSPTLAMYTSSSSLPPPPAQTPPPPAPSQSPPTSVASHLVPMPIGGGTNGLPYAFLPIPSPTPPAAAPLGTSATTPAPPPTSASSLVAAQTPTKTPAASTLSTTPSSLSRPPPHQPLFKRKPTDPPPPPSSSSASAVSAGISMHRSHSGPSSRPPRFPKPPTPTSTPLMAARKPVAAVPPASLMDEDEEEEEEEGAGGWELVDGVYEFND